MRKAIKISLYLIGGLLVLYIIAIILAAVLIEPKNISALINKNLYKSTGHTVNIEGDIKLTLFPWVGVRVSKLTVDNPKGFAAPKEMPYLAKIGKADVRVAMWPLFFGTVKPKKIVLMNTTINLVKLKSGQTNWEVDGISKNASATTKILPPSSNDTSKIFNKQTNDSFEPAAKWLAETIIIDDANLNYLNNKTNQLFELHHLNVQSDAVNPSRYINLKLSFNLQNNNPAINVDIKTNFGGKLNFNTQEYNIQQLRLNGRLYTWKHPLKKPVDFTLSTKASANLTHDWMKLSSLIISIANAKLEANLDINQMSNNPVVIGEIKIGSFNARELLAALGMPVLQKNILNNVALNTTLSTSAGFIKLNPITVFLDGSKLSGMLQIASHQQSNLQFELALTKLNLDPYLKALNSFSTETATAVSKTQPQVAPKTKSATTKEVLPVEFLKSTQWKGSIKAEQISYHGLTLKNLSFNTQNQNDTVTISPLQTNIGDGKASASLTLNIKQTSPAINIKLDGNNLPIADILDALHGSSFVSGALNLQSTLNMHGNDMQAWMNALNGSGKINITQGSLHDLDIAKFIELGTAFIQKKSKTTTTTTSGNTPFTQASASYTIQNGVVHNNDLTLNSSELAATGHGDVNLANSTIDYYLTAAYNNSKVQVPLLLKGNLAKPKIELDVQSLAGSLIKSTIKKNIQKIFNLFK